MNTVVYHTGDFKNKARDTDLHNNDLGRSTGFFGTGYYFCTSPEKCAAQGKSNTEPRPMYSFSIEGLNLITGDFYLHDRLKNINRIVSFWPWISVDKDNWSSLIYWYGKVFPYSESYYNEIQFGDYLKENWEYVHKQYPDLYPTFTDWFGENYYEKSFIESCNSINELQSLAKELSLNTPNFEKINELSESDYLDREWKDKIFELKTRFNIDLTDQEKKICESIYNELSQYYKKGILRRTDIPLGLDSIPTRFLKAKGYDGVYPSPECDSISYGGVVYDMPKDIKQIGLAKDYLSNSKHIFSKLFHN